MLTRLPPAAAVPAQGGTVPHQSTRVQPRGINRAADLHDSCGGRMHSTATRQPLGQASVRSQETIMKNYIFTVLAAVSLTVALAVCAVAAPEDGPGITAEFKLSSPAVSLGEPVILSYRITNSSGVPIQIDWQKEDLARGSWQSFKLPPWLDVKIADSLGHTVPFKTDVRRAYAVDRWVQYPAPTLAVGASRDADVLLSLWF